MGSVTRFSESAQRRARGGTRPGRVLAFALCALAASGCASAPERIDHHAAAQGLQRQVIAGERFRHVVYQRREPRAGSSLDVYIEGDGRPWLYGGTLVADDPTPRNPYALDLMAKDPRPAVYLGRPCYFGLAADTPCDKRYWTGARYAPEVIASMAAALKHLLAERGNPAVVLVGYSGGGALAALLAPRVPRLQALVTIAANLDTARWTRLHGYLPLTGSRNPMTAANLTGVPQMHYAGGKDAVVPAGMIRAFAVRHGGRYREIADFTHACCWQTRWPDLLRTGVAALSPAATTRQVSTR